jgi:hypothetical protein
MGFWDAGTHMNKKEWAASCRRVINRLQSLKSVLTTRAEPPAAAVMQSELGGKTASRSRTTVAKVRPSKARPQKK